MDSASRQRLRELAEAYPEDFRTWRLSPLDNASRCVLIGSLPLEAWQPSHDIARYIAAVSPSVVTALLDRLDEAEKLLVRARIRLDYGHPTRGSEDQELGIAITNALKGCGP